MQRSEFHVDRVTLCGYWHFPDAVAGPWPLVVMGHGFAAEWHFGTAPYIEAFNALGCAVFSFDYRHFGDSGGEPRQFISVQRQLQDWRAALEHVRNDPRCKPDRIALWGSSFGGGHALSIAAEEPGLAAVVVQVPHCDSRGMFRRTPLRDVIGMTAHGLYDQLCGLVGRVHTVPVVAESGELAALNYPGWKSAYLRLVSPDSGWRNAIPARSMLAVANYNPIDTADRIRCPVLIVYGKRDAGIPESTVLATAECIADCRVWGYDGGHFEIYAGPIHEQCLAQEVDFLCRHLAAQAAQDDRAEHHHG